MYKRIITIIFFISLFVATVMHLCSCSISNNSFESTTNESVEVAETEKETEPLTVKQILKKAKKYLNIIMPLKNSTVDDEGEGFGENAIAIFPNNNDEKILDFSVYFDNGAKLTIDTSTIRDLTSYGFKKGNQKNAYKSDEIDFTQDIYLLLNNKYLHVGADRISDQEVFGDLIRNVALDTDKKAVDFNYYGFTKDSTLNDVISSLGYPNSSCSIRYFEDSDKCWISLGYSDQYNSNKNASLSADFNFTYDYNKNTSKLSQIYLSI